MAGLTQADIQRMRDQLFFEGPERGRRLSRYGLLLPLSAVIASAGACCRGRRRDRDPADTRASCSCVTLMNHSLDDSRRECAVIKRPDSMYVLLSNISYGPRSVHS
jgi:hypothetical protein